MPKTHSRRFVETVSRTSATESPRVLLEITHPNLPTPIRVINDNADLVSNGNTFIAMGFSIVLPDESDQQLPRATIEVDNVGEGPDGNSLADWLERSGGGAGAQIRLLQVLRSHPDVIEWEITLDLSNVHLTFLKVSGELGFDDLLNRPGIILAYRPETAPGLF